MGSEASQQAPKSATPILSLEVALALEVRINAVVDRHQLPRWLARDREVEGTGSAVLLLRSIQVNICPEE